MILSLRLSLVKLEVTLQDHSETWMVFSTPLQGMACTIFAEMLRETTWAKIFVTALTSDQGRVHQGRWDTAEVREGVRRCEPTAGAEINTISVRALQYKRRMYHCSPIPNTTPVFTCHLPLLSSLFYCSDGPTHLQVSDKRVCS